MSPKAKKSLIITGLALDAALTILLFVFSLVMLFNMPETRFDIDSTTFIGWFQTDPIRILLLDVIPLAALLILNLFITIKFFKGDTAKKKNVSLNDLSDEEKEALKKKILEEMMGNKEENK